MSAVAIPQEVFEAYSIPDVDQRIAAYWWGKPDPQVAWWLSLCRLVAEQPIAQSLYLARVAEDLSQQRAIKNWAYAKAAAFVGAKGSGQRHRSLVESYRLDWGHQAARDGVAIALWGDIMDVPGLSGRAEHFHCGRQAYGRVRDEMEREARDLLAAFRADMEMCESGDFSRDFINRWESVTGGNWAALNWTAKSTRLATLVV
jgi:hypothetical protein